MSDWDGENRRAPQRWKINKEISLADLLSFISAALAVVYAYTTLDKRVTVLEVSMHEAKEVTAAKEQDNIRYQARIDAQLQALNEKLDKVLARR